MSSLHLQEALLRGWLEFGRISIPQVPASIAMSKTFQCSCSGSQGCTDRVSQVTRPRMSPPQSHPEGTRQGQTWLESYQGWRYFQASTAIKAP